VARALAEESITLLKNDGNLLPLDAAQIKTLAVIGPNAAVAVSGAGSSRVEGAHRISPLEGLKAALGKKVAVEYEPGCDNQTDVPAVLPAWVQTPDGQPGLRGEYFNNVNWAGQPDLVRIDGQLEFWGFGSGPADNIASNHFSARWVGRITVPESGQYALKLICTGRCRVFWGGAVLFDNVGPAMMNIEDSFAMAATMRELTAGVQYEIKVEYAQHPGQEFANWRLGLGRNYRPGEDQRLARAVALARRADVVVLCVGMPEGYESEGFDRPNMDLPGAQNELINAVVRVNPRTVVVLNTGVAVTMPWLDAVPALLEAYYPGQENGHALANILLGAVNPSGKLPVTFPKRLEDIPGYLCSSYPGARDVIYGEGVFVGYRGFDQRALEPLFPFGFGLSYTTFAYKSVKAPETAKAGETVTVQVTVQNTGARAGQEVVQVYVHDRQASVPRPPRELKAFAKVALQPGGVQTLSFKLDARAFAFYDACRRQWIVEPGEFEIQIGSSSRHIHARAVIKLE
jgi:beta-glucosidase